MPDLVGRATLRRELDDGLVLERVSCPLGLLGVVFESRPDALVQIVGLAWKSGNAVLLKGGREATTTNQALIKLVHGVLEQARHRSRAPPCCSRAARTSRPCWACTAPSTSSSRAARRSSCATSRATRASPSWATPRACATSTCTAPPIPRWPRASSSTRRRPTPAACNAAEALLWDAEAGAALDACVAALAEAGVEMRA